MESFIERPILAASCRQLGVLVLDDGSTMQEPVTTPDFSGTKEEAVSAAVGDLTARVRVSSRAEQIGLTTVPFSRAAAAGESASMAAGLAVAEQRVAAFLGGAGGDDLPRTATVLLLTDGESGTADGARDVAGRLRADPRVRFAAALFASGGRIPPGRALLREICSSPAQVWSKVVHDPEGLRRFFQWSLQMTVGPGHGSADPLMR